MSSMQIVIWSGLKIVKTTSHLNWTFFSYIAHPNEQLANCRNHLSAI